jgi:hypothetical protein
LCNAGGAEVGVHLGDVPNEASIGVPLRWAWIIPQQGLAPWQQSRVPIGQLQMA